MDFNHFTLVVVATSQLLHQLPSVLVDLKIIVLI